MSTRNRISGWLYAYGVVAGIFVGAVTALSLTGYWS